MSWRAAALFALLAHGCGRPCNWLPVLQGACGGTVVEGVPTAISFLSDRCDGTGLREPVRMVDVLSSDPRVFTVAEQPGADGGVFVLIAGATGTARVIADPGPDFSSFEYQVIALSADAGPRDAGAGCAPVAPLLPE